METAKIKFADGTEITTEMNGNNFVTDNEPTFPEDMSEVVIEKGDETITLTNARVQECAPIDDRFYFIFLEATQEEVIESQVFYTAMMTDTLLED